MDTEVNAALIAYKGAQSISDLLQAMGRRVLHLDAVGSRVTCDPAPTDTDEDWLMLVSRFPRDAAFEDLRAAGFTQDGNPEFYTGNDAGGFRSWRRGDVNVVTTQDEQFYDLFMTATHLAKRFNLLLKADRIALFQAVLYGVRTQNLVEREHPIDEILALPSDVVDADPKVLEPFTWLAQEDGDIDSAIGRTQFVYTGVDEIILHAFDDEAMDRRGILTIAVPAVGMVMREIESGCMVAQMEDAQQRLGRILSNWGDWVATLTGRTVHLRMTDVSWEDHLAA